MYKRLALKKAGLICIELSPMQQERDREEVSIVGEDSISPVGCSLKNKTGLLEGNGWILPKHGLAL